MEAQTGGWIGSVELGQLHPTLAQILTVAQPGQFFPPILLEQWFAIVRLEQRIPAQLNAAMEQRLLDRFFESWLRDALQSNLPE